MFGAPNVGKFSRVWSVEACLALQTPYKFPSNVFVASKLSV